MIVRRSEGTFCDFPVFGKPEALDAQLAEKPIFLRRSDTIVLVCELWNAWRRWDGSRLR